jgi:predicted cupin superfamily sugar epimerase
MIFESPRTDSTLIYLFLRQDKHREQFYHNSNNDICHRFGRWDVDIDVEAFQEIAQALEEIEEVIII